MIQLLCLSRSSVKQPCEARKTVRRRRCFRPPSGHRSHPRRTNTAPVITGTFGIRRQSSCSPVVGRETSIASKPGHNDANSSTPGVPCGLHTSGVCCVGHNRVCVPRLNCGPHLCFCCSQVSDNSVVSREKQTDTRCKLQTRALSGHGERCEVDEGSAPRGWALTQHSCRPSLLSQRGLSSRCMVCSLCCFVEVQNTWELTSAFTAAGLALFASFVPILVQRSPPCVTLRSTILYCGVADWRLYARRNPTALFHRPGFFTLGHCGSTSRP